MDMYGHIGVMYMYVYVYCMCMYTVFTTRELSSLTHCRMVPFPQLQVMTENVMHNLPCGPGYSCLRVYIGKNLNKCVL